MLNKGCQFLCFMLKCVVFVDSSACADTKLEQSLPDASNQQQRESITAAEAANPAGTSAACGTCYILCYLRLVIWAAKGLTDCIQICIVCFFHVSSPCVPISLT